MHLRSLVALLLVAVGTVVLLACSSEAKLGEACDEPGKTSGECEQGAVCAKDNDGAVRCLQVCTDHPQCPSGKECNGVEGSSLKACRIKK